MSRTASEESQRKTYVSYKNDRSALARIVSANRKRDAKYSEGDAIRDSLIEKAATL